LAYYDSNNKSYFKVSKSKLTVHVLHFKGHWSLDPFSTHVSNFRGHWNLDPFSTITLEHMSYISKVIRIWITSQLSPRSTFLTFQRSLESGSFINYHPVAHVLHFNGHWTGSFLNYHPVAHVLHFKEHWNLDPFSMITLEQVSYISKIIGNWILSQLSPCIASVLHFKGLRNLDSSQQSPCVPLTFLALLNLLKGKSRP
jgi:hypothetical protein